jgi:glycosyltransferase involved in cell wall biosynthesis
VRACVVVPARDEEELIGGCIDALAAQTGIDRSDYEVLLVLDRCTDATEARARAAARDLNLRIVHAGDPGVGHARRQGFDLAAQRLPPDGLIATTDADSRPEPDWLLAQLDAVARGAHAIGGLIEIGDPETLPPAALARRAAEAAQRHAALQGPGAREHHQFSGGSIGVTAATYTLVGLEPRHALEDEGFERALHRHGIPIDRLSTVRVTTSGRRHGRAPRGLAVDLQRASWLAERGYAARDFPLDELLRLKRETISVVLPARAVSQTLDQVLHAIASLDELVDETLVIAADPESERAARRHDVTVLPESTMHPPVLGKGDAMYRGLQATDGALVAFLDTDTEDFHPRFVLGLLGPLLADDSVDFVKGHFRRPLKIGGRLEPDGGGRVTELVARPYLNLHFPTLAGFLQPLAGEVAARRELLERLPFPVGYGVEIAMLIDSLRAAGLERMAQVDLGTRQNRHQPLRDLSRMALEVLTAAERRAHGDQAIAEAAPGPLLIRAGGDFELSHALVDERPPLSRAARAPRTPRCRRG